MIRERIADEVYVFTSRRYAQVTAGAVLTKEGAVLIDTLYYPDEARSIQQFLEERLGYHVRYVINTHYHADHTTGTYLYPQALVISHTLCREMLDTVGRVGLAQTKEQLAEFAEVELVLPNMTVTQGNLDLEVGGKTIRLLHTPGHSHDLMSVHVLEENILFASDTMMPVPTIFDGAYEDLVASLRLIMDLKPDTVVQGHGEVVLRGEINAIIQDDLKYLNNIRKKVRAIIQAGGSERQLEQLDIESCGKSRIPLNGLVADLHHANLRHLYRLYATLEPTPL